MIWFLAEDGVHRFNGNRFESVAEFLKIRPSVTNKECGFGFCGEYYILQYQDLRQGVRRSVAIHEDGKSGYFISDREALSYGYGRTLCKNNSHEICYLAENGSLAYNESYFFESQRTDLGVAGRKTVRKIRVEGEGNITLYLRTGLRQCAVQGKITNGVLEHKVRLRGDEFSFYIVLNGGACVRSVRVDFETVA
jgi:hypothetical protein